jgi:hypothetical protein
MNTTGTGNQSSRQAAAKTGAKNRGGWRQSRRELMECRAERKWNEGTKGWGGGSGLGDGRGPRCSVGMLLAGRCRLRLLWGMGRFMLNVAATKGRAIGIARVPGRGPQAGNGWAMDDSPTSGLAHEWWAQRPQPG